MLGLSNTLTNASTIVGESAWTPAKLTGLKGWYRKGSGITLDSQDDVTRWEDQSNSNNHLTATGVSANSPTYDEINEAVHFNASGDILTFTSSWDLGTFAIYFRCEISSYDGDFIFEETSNEFWKIHTNDDIRVKIAGGSRHDISNISGQLGSALATGTKINFGLERNVDGALFCFVNNTALNWDSGDGAQTFDVSAGTGLFEITTIGKPATDVKFYEIIICNASQSSTNRTNLQAYLELI